MSTIRLTTTSYVVLGLVEWAGTVTPYDIKQLAESTVANFWPVAHTQLYAETARLARELLLDEQQEEGGRRRKAYSITPAGRAALDAWRADRVDPGYELRDAGTLKLFFGADPRRLAAEQIAVHEAKLAEYEARDIDQLPEGVRLALACGIGHEREFVRFWRAVADGKTP